MSEVKRESSSAVKAIHEKWAEWVSHNGRETGKRTVADAYDALDYRLMATFPASDAIAQY